MNCFMLKFIFMYIQILYNLHYNTFVADCLGKMMPYAMVYFNVIKASVIMPSKVTHMLHYYFNTMIWSCID